MPARRITTSSERIALLPTSTGINTRNPDTPAGGAESCCHRRHVLTMFGFWACFCMEVSRNFSVVVIPMAKEFGWDHATVGAVFASSYCEWRRTRSLAYNACFLRVMGALAWLMWEHVSCVVTRRWLCTDADPKRGDCAPVQ